MAHCFTGSPSPDMVFGTPKCTWWVRPMLALGVKKDFFECFWQCTPCMVKRPKMQLKKWGGGRFFQDFLNFSYLTFLTTTPTCQKVAKGVGMGLFRCKNQCQTMGQNPHRQGLARAPRAGTVWWGNPCIFWCLIYKTINCEELSLLKN